MGRYITCAICDDSKHDDDFEDEVCTECVRDANPDGRKIIQNDTIDRMLAFTLEEPESISSSHSTRHGFALAVNMMRRKLESMKDD